MLQGRLRRRRIWVAGASAAVLVASAIVVASQRRPDPLALLETAAREFDAGRIDEAERRLDARSRRVAPTPLDLILRARIAQARGRFDEALGWLGAVSEVDPFAGQARLLAGEIELDRDRARWAEPLFVRALQLDPKQVAARRDLAYIYALQRRRRECDAQFRALSALGPLDDKRAFLWCQNLCGIWDPREATERLERFVKTDPGDRWSRLALVEGYLLTNQVAAADHALTPLGADDDDARALRARVALERNDERGAEVLAQRGANDHPALNYVRARLALMHQDTAAAARLYEAILRVNPQDRDALYGVGQCLRQLGDSAAAVKILDTVNRQDRLKRMIVESKGPQGRDPKLYFNLGRACEAIGRPLEAQTWYGLAIARDPFDAAAQAARARLKQCVDVP